VKRTVALLLVAACGTAAPVHRQAPAGAARKVVPAADTTPADTTPPLARAGMLVTRAPSEPGTLDGRWRPHAGVCATPPTLQLLVQSDSLDLLLLLNLPEDSAPVGTYAVVLPTDTAGPAAHTAQIGVQQMRYTDLAYQGSAGTVRLERLDRSASGTFDATLQEAPSHRTFRFLGVFDAIPVDTLGAAACRLAEPDTAHAAVGRKPA
jgi:hypothetical protein